MTTPNSTSVNRANAQRSTGPKTPEGKQRSSLNALRHGLTGQIVVMPAEDLQAYRLHVKAFTEHYQPADPPEAHLVQVLADTAWRQNRVAALETNLLTLGVANAEHLINAPEQIQNALAIAAAVESQSKALSNLSMHSQRLCRQFEKTVAQLRDLQNTRRAQGLHDMASLLDILEMHESTGKRYNPSADGFVFSDQQIKEAKRARRRENLALEAHEYCLEAAA